MIRKYSKLIAIAAAVGLSVVPVSAKEITFDELQDLISETTSYETEAKAVHIIGEHVFTNLIGDNYTDEDVIAAMESINNVPSAKHSYFLYTYGDEGWTLSGQVGNTEGKLNEKFNITTIDTKPIEDTLGDAIKNAIDELTKTYNEQKGKYSDTDLTALTEAYETAKATMEKAADEAAITAARDAYDTTVEGLKTDVQKAEQKIIDQAFADTVEALRGYAELLKADYPNAEEGINAALDKLEGKEVDSIEAINEAANAAKEAMDAAVEEAKETVPVEDIVNGIIANVNKTAGENVLVVSKEDKAITVSLKTSKLPESIGLVGAIRTAMKNYELIDSIVLKYNNAEFVLDDAGWVDGDKAKGSVVAQKINEMFGIMIGDGSIIDLDAKTISVIYNINEKAKNEEKVVTYTLTFVNDQKVNTNEEMNKLIDTANTATETPDTTLTNAFVVSGKDSNDITVTIKNRNLKVADINNTGLATALATLLGNSAYTSIDITEVLAEGAEQEAKTYTITSESTTTEIKENVLKVLGISSKLGDVTGKTVKVTLNYDTDSYKNESASNEYTITFKTIVDPNEYFVKTENPQSYSFACDSVDEATGKCVPVLNILKPENNITNGLDAIAKTVIQAVNDGSKEVQIKVGNNITVATYNKDTASQLTVSGGNGLINLITAALNKEKATYADLKNLPIIITFIADKDNGYSFVREDATYTLEIGQFVDFDGVMKALVDASNKSDAYSLTMNGNELTLDVKLANNTVSIDAILDSINSSLKTSADKFDIKLGEIKYDKDNDDSTNNGTLRKAFYSLLGVNNYSAITPAVMANAKDLKVELTTKTESAVAYPGTVGVLSNDDKTATYTIHFTVSNLDLNSFFELKDASEHFTTTYDKETVDSNIYNVALSNINDKLVCASAEDTNCVKGSGLMVALQSFAPLFKELTINGTTIDLTSTTTIADGIKTVLASYEVETVEDLASITDGIKVSVTLANNVKAAQELTDSKYEFTIKFNTDNAIQEFNANSGKLSELIVDGVEKIILTENVSISEQLDLSKDFEIVGNNNTITTNVKLSGNIELKLSNVTLDGKLTVDGTGSEITITGDDNTVVKGGIDASEDAKVKNLTITSVKVEGTSDDLIGNSKKAVINATGAEEFTMIGSSVKYTGDDSDSTGEQIYSLIQVDGNTTIKDSTFDISKIKNPIEFKYYNTGSERINKIDIIGNTFTGDNYVVEDSHNVISIYALKEGAVVNIKNNTFGYANSMLRISNNGATSVTFNIVENTVEKYNDNDTKNRGLIVIRPNNKVDLSKITINHKDNKFGTELYKYDKETMDQSSDTRLVYVNDKNSKDTENELVVKDYTE